MRVKLVNRGGAVVALAQRYSSGAPRA